MHAAVALGVAAWATFIWSMVLRESLEWDNPDPSEVVFSVVGIAVSAASIPIGVLAFVGGLGLSWRRRRGVRVTRWWTVAQLAAGVVAMGLFFWAYVAFSMGASGDPWDEAILWLWALAMGGWLVGWPLVVGLWMRRWSVRNETRTWR